MSPETLFGGHNKKRSKHNKIWYPSEVWRLIFFALFLIIIKSPNEVWRLIVFAPFVIIIMNICQKLWPHLYRKLPKGFPQDLAYILNRVGRILWMSIFIEIREHWNFADFVGGNFFLVRIFYQPYLIYMPSLVEIPLAVFDISDGYLQGIRHAAPYGDHFGWYWWPFWIQNDRQN
jgi:hypothetical protein